jgi:hypothetical protein
MERPKDEDIWVGRKADGEKSVEREIKEETSG